MMDNLYTQLETNGFFITDLLNDDELTYLNQLCDKYLRKSDTDFVSSSHVLNKTDSDLINAELHTILETKFKRLFPDLELLGGTLATKTKGSSNLEAHQDWTIVDETKFNSFNLWIPLIDTNTENGTLGLIPGSHKWNRNLRGFNIPNPYGKFTNQFLKIGFEPSLKAGQAILYNHKLIHYSRQNQTDSNRNVAIVGVKDKMAALQISFSKDGHHVDTYTMNQAEFYQFDINSIIAAQTKLSNGKIETEPVKWSAIYTNFIANTSKEFINDSYTGPKILARLKKSLDRIFS